jgi:rare lipoprotein A
LWTSLVLALALSACAETNFLLHTAKKMRDGPPGGVYKVGEPYQVNGVWYTPVVDYGYDETGIASWYGADFHGKLTANGETYDMNEVTAAHKTLPMPSLARVTNLENGRSLIVRVNDRGPFVAGRIIDLSRRSAQLLGLEGKGTGRVRVQILAEESRQIAERMTAQGAVAVRAGESPRALNDSGRTLPKPANVKDGSLTVAQLPKAEVAKEELAPPPGMSQAPAPKPVASRTVSDAPLEASSERAPAANAAARAGESPRASIDAPLSGRALAKVGTVSQGAPRATQIYVQAGAFGHFENAHKTSAKLAGVGPVAVSPVLVKGRDVFRVRIGPIASVEEADLTLERVIRAGYGDARVVVD